MRRFLCWLGRHDYSYGRERVDGHVTTVRSCGHCRRVWRRVRFDMDIHWERIPEEGR